MGSRVAGRGAGEALRLDAEGHVMTLRPKRRIRWRRVRCPICGDSITSNALGRAAHVRHCQGREARQAKDKPLTTGRRP